MANLSSDKSAGKQSASLEVLQDIDACCDQFEAEWIAGSPPSLTAYVDRLPANASDEARHQLLRELLAIELEYRLDEQGRRMSAGQIVALHPGLDSDIADEFQQLPTVRSQPDRSKPGSAGPGAEAGSGLHIQCPHCQNQVELLDDAPLEEITCKTCGSNFSLVGKDDPEALRAAPHRRIGRFELVELLGMGGFGAVWRAHDADLDRSVALKIPRRGQISRTEAELFFREARAAAQLRHPHIVPVHEVGRDGDTIFIVSDLIDGEPLSERIKSSTPTFRESAEILEKVALALDAAHERGVVHRDLKPSNVMIDLQGEPHLMDFGLAKRQAGEITMTVDGQVLGTPAFMSPEQAAGETKWIDRRTDIYSFGVMLFQMLTGELPFRGSMHSQIKQRLEDDPPSPRKLNARVPEDLATICLKCLEREPNRRYDTALDLGAELRRFLRGEPINARPISRLQRAARWAKRNPAPATVVVLAGVLAVAGPVAAVLFADLNRRLSSELAETKALIARSDSESEADAESIRTLAAEKERLTAANPVAAHLPGDLQAIVARKFLDANFAAAVEQIEALPATSPQRPAAHRSLARLLRMAGRNEEALGQYRGWRTWWSERLEADPEDAAARQAFAIASAELSDALLELDRREESDQIAAEGLAMIDELVLAGDGTLADRVRRYFAVADHARRSTRRLSGQPLDSTGEAAQLARRMNAARADIDANWSADPQSVVELAEALIVGRD